jgi:hypothetical protein
MTDVIVNRNFEPAMDLPAIYELVVESGSCFNMHRVNWHGSLLADSGTRLLCHFDSADTESIRLALRQTGAEEFNLWPVTVHHSPDNANLDPNVAVQRSWQEPVDIADIQDLEDAGAWCLDAYNVKFVRTYFSADRKHMICLYAAPDAESVRQVQRQINMPVDDVWVFELVKPL